MPISDDVAPGTIVRVPFPYTDAEAGQHRPALVLARTGPQDAGGAALLLWVLMITSATNRSWPGDILIANHAAAGLPAPSVIRTAKIATIDFERAEMRGQIDGETLTKVQESVAAHLAGQPQNGR